MKKFFLFFISLVMVISLCSCKNETDEEISGKVNVEISFKDYGVVKLELDSDAAPITVANFVKLTKEGFYDGTIMHRVVKDFMIQGGDDNGDGIGGSSETIKGEFSANGVENSISHKRGVISMARTNDYNSASSQFFICHQDATSLDGQYAAFGYVTEGIEVVDAIANCEVEPNAYGTEISVPVENIVVEYIKVVD